MPDTQTLGLAMVAALIAFAGLWWFRMVLKERLLAMRPGLRFGLYALIWLAYFTVIIILAMQSGAG
ncbi:MAG: hypothetical protein AAGJ73_01000 [Pseudomonadota bacterium]